MNLSKVYCKVGRIKFDSLQNPDKILRIPDFKSGHLFEQKTVFILAAMGVASFFFCKKEKDTTDSATDLSKKRKSFCSSIFLILLVFAWFSK